VKKPFRIALWIVGSIVGVVVLLVVVGLWGMSNVGYVFPDHDLPRHLTGRWDWSTHKNRCGDGAHVIAFSPDLKTMTISMPRTAADTGWTATYDILWLGESRVRGAIRGETRLTDGGAPVVWDLVMFGPDEYHWQRLDWKSWAYTPGILRCG
jgi:hypothetical protein